MEKKNKEALITVQGSLAVLALGSVGIKKWREVIREGKQDKQESKEDEKKDS